jgi:hypothetical protein
MACERGLDSGKIQVLTVTTMKMTAFWVLRPVVS